MKRRIRCSCVAADGSQCGRTVTDGSQPPVCHIHKNKANGTLAGIAQPTLRTPKEIVEKLLHDNDPTVRLRALDLWIKHFESRQTDDRQPYRELVSRMTEAERNHVAACLDAIATIKAAVYARHPELEPDRLTLARRQREPEPQSAPAIDVASAAAPVTAAVTAGDPVEDAEPSSCRPPELEYLDE